MKRQREGGETSERPAKIIRVPAVDRLSGLSDELLVRILSFSSVSTLLTCQRVSKKLGRIAVDSELWKAAYYNQFVRPRASRISGIKNTREGGGTSEHLCYSSKLSKWLDDGHLVKRGHGTNWKQQYRLRHNWSQGQCAVSEIVVADRPPEPPLLVLMHDSMIFTADSIDGLRVWSSRDERDIIASTSLELPGNNTTPRLPTSMGIDSSRRADGFQRIAIGFEDGSFAIYALEKAYSSFKCIFSHPPSSNGMLSSLAYTSPYLLTMTEDQVVSLYTFPLDNTSLRQPPDMLDAPKLLYSLRSYTAWPPVSLSLRTNTSSMTAAIAYAIPTYLSGWTVGVQEMRLSHSGELIESRLATATNPHVHTVLTSSRRETPTPQTSTEESPSTSVSSTSTTLPGTSQPTTMSYSHPYLLAAHPDNTLSLYLVTSTASSLIISPGTRLWGHTSCVSGAYVGGRGKAVSVSRLGDELRVWDLEGGGLGVKRRDKERERATGIASAGTVSVRVQPQPRPTKISSPSGEYGGGDGFNTPDEYNTAVARGEGLKEALSRCFDEEPAVSSGWVGFDDRNVVVLREKAEGKQTLVVYDFA